MIERQKKSWVLLGVKAKAEKTAGQEKKMSGRRNIRQGTASRRFGPAGTPRGKVVLSSQAVVTGVEELWQSCEVRVDLWSWCRWKVIVAVLA